MRPIKQSQAVSREVHSVLPTRGPGSAGVVPAQGPLEMIKSALASYGPTLACAACRALCGPQP